MSDIYVCMCGETPDHLTLTDNGQGTKWASATCSECGEWSIEFRTNYLSLESEECKNLAINAWNAAPRGLTQEIEDLKQEIMAINEYYED